MSSVYHLFRQLDRLVDEIKTGLGEAADPLTPVPGTLGKSGRSSARIMLRNEYGILFQPAPADEEDTDEEEDEEGEGEDTDDEGKARGKKSGPAQISSDQPLLAVHIAIYDPQKQEAAEPRIEFAVLGNWRVGRNTTRPDDEFHVARHMLRRIPRAVSKGGNLSKGATVETGAVAKSDVGKKKGDEKRLYCDLLAAGATLPLYDMDQPGAVQSVVARLIAMWEEASRTE